MSFLSLLVVSQCVRLTNALQHLLYSVHLPAAVVSGIWLWLGNTIVTVEREAKVLDRYLRSLVLVGIGSLKNTCSVEQKRQALKGGLAT